MIITEFDGTRFRGTMSYPDSLTVTEISGTARPRNGSNPESPQDLVWQETSYRNRGRRSIDFNGEYRATVTGNELIGSWYQGERRIADFRMSATG